MCVLFGALCELAVTYIDHIILYFYLLIYYINMTVCMYIYSVIRNVHQHICVYIVLLFTVVILHLSVMFI